MSSYCSPGLVYYMRSKLKLKRAHVPVSIARVLMVEGELRRLSHFARPAEHGKSGTLISNAVE